MSEDLNRCLIYGAYGYTGDLIARLAAARGFRPTLAGRSAHKLEPLAKELGLPWVVVGLDDDAALDAALADFDAVLHCAGPFSRTSKPMVQACLRTGTHYLDITGEIAVFEACARKDEAAKAAGVMLLPGVGFDVVPSDCLAAHLKARLPDATELQMAFSSVGGGISHGTATTAVENLGEPSAIRKDGVISPVRMGSRSRRVDFGRGPVPCLGIPWGDVSTAFHSTGIPNIEVFIRVPGSAILGARIGGWLSPLMKTGFVRGLAQRRIDAAPAGPSQAARVEAFTVLWGEATSPTGRAEARLKVVEGYTLTAQAGLESARRACTGGAVPGYQTPSKAFGADYILQFEGSEFTEL